MSRVEDVTPDEAWDRTSEPKYAEAMAVAQETLNAALGRPDSRVVSALRRPTQKPSGVEAIEGVTESGSGVPCFTSPSCLSRL